MVLLGFARSSFQDFEGYLISVGRLDGDDIQLVLKKYNSEFITHEIVPCIHSYKGFLKAVYTMCDHE